MLWLHIPLMLSELSDNRSFNFSIWLMTIWLNHRKVVQYVDYIHNPTHNYMFTYSVGLLLGLFLVEGGSLNVGLVCSLRQHDSINNFHVTDCSPESSCHSFSCNWDHIWQPYITSIISYRDPWCRYTLHRLKSFGHHLILWPFFTSLILRQKIQRGLKKSRLIRIIILEMIRGQKDHKRMRQVLEIDYF